ncbi:1-acyl-sn-glycerol-3-phosphate acyltransferase [Flammeovirga sp. EKP202]|uniref:1-acyl-sn-glycerol-3-phosphate acyltransferase n=1 Tax=Flammeovirga sp. EKP202 TaxID=2770592 RepID=UPI00165F601A|nr:1-acyl-sn-glycerol-3-phosphate acyltransferase [Flammeovirga sp. EKP202]MBD0402869.1 1-acyl-sn-glycerol-3-phosphate acyltransferase [Flammeovirga sp. EKP202]
MRTIWIWLFKLAGWKVEGIFPNEVKKMVVVVGPHTSFWDFMVGVPARDIVGIKAKFFIKSTLCKGLLGRFLLKQGAIPVVRTKNTRLVDQVIQEFNQREELIMAVTPEGTRSYNDNWKTGFYRIAMGANVPIYMVGMCFKTKRIVFGEYIIPSGNIEEDTLKIKTYLSQFVGKHPQKGIRLPA